MFLQGSGRIGGEMKMSKKLTTTAELDELEGGKADDTLSTELDSDELAKGIEIEKEHTNDENLAEEIAKDHLKEIPDYYTRLQKMEEEAKAELSNDDSVAANADDLFVVLKIAARQDRRAMGIPLTTPTDEEGNTIAQRLGLIYNGLQEQVPPKSPLYTFTDPITKSSFLATDFEEAQEGISRMRERSFSNPSDISQARQFSKLNLKKTAITWPFGKPDVPEEQEGEVVEPVARIEPPKFQTRRSPDITEKPVEATPEQAELIQALATSKTHIEQLQLEVKQIQDELRQKIAPIQTQIGVEGQNQLSATKQLVAMMAELEQELIQAGDQVGYYTEQVVSQKLTPTAKVKILLERFGPKAEQAISEAQKNLDEISQVVIIKYRQWPTKTSVVEGIDEQYLATLYQNAYNTMAGLLDDVQELNFALMT